MEQMLSTQTQLSLMQATNKTGMAQEILQKGANLDTKRIDETAQDFEAVFIYEMMKPMFEGIDVDPVFGGGKGEEIFRGMMLDEYSKSMAQKDITGLQNEVRNKLIEIQAQSTKGNS